MVNNHVSEDANETNPSNIAEESWRLYSQRPDSMALETNIDEPAGDFVQDFPWIDGWVDGE